MNHDEAIREQAVERYLLGELPKTRELASKSTFLIAPDAHRT